MKKSLLFLTTFIMVSLALTGQKAPIKFGDISLEELQMTSYPLDTSASVVVLCDYGYLNPSTAQFTLIRRIKVLKKEGVYWANNGFPFSPSNSVKGITANLENGKVVKDKLKNESVFRDKITEDRTVTRLAMPNVKVGSVIDIQFTFYGLLQEWKFQDEIPVKYSELVVPYVNGVGFTYNYFGYEPLFLSSPTRWIAKDMPAFKEEPFMSSKENYLTKLEFDLSSISYYSLTKTWEDACQLLLKADKFGGAIGNSAFLNDLAESVADSADRYREEVSKMAYEAVKSRDKLDNTVTDIAGRYREEVLKMVYEAIKTHIKWNESVSLVTSSPNLNFPYRMKIGNSADINLILLQLLRKLDFEAIPVVMSTRENGFISKLTPSITKLNYVIVQARVGDKYYLLDASEKYLPYYLIPFRCLNGTGRTVDLTKSNEVVLSTAYKDKDYTTYQLKLNTDESLEGKMLVRHLDYSAFDFRKKYSGFNSAEEYLEDFKKDKTGLDINDYKINNIDSIYLPAIEDYDIKIHNQANLFGNDIYIIPTFYSQLRENPFKMDTRNYPVDFGYNTEKTITSIIEIPENYEVAELPAPVNIKMADNAASLTYIVARSGKTINIKSIFSINKPVFLPNEYKLLREFYDQVIKKQSEPIILKKL